MMKLLKEFFLVTLLLKKGFFMIPSCIVFSRKKIIRGSIDRIMGCLRIMSWDPFFSNRLRHVFDHAVQRSSVLVLEVVFDGLGQIQLCNFALFNAFFVDRLTNDAATEIHKWQRFRI